VRFEEFTGYADFKKFDSEIAISFKKSLAKNSGKPLTISTISSVLRNLRDFYAWLSNEPGYKSIKVNEIDYLKLTENEERMARSSAYKPAPTLAQVKRVIDLMPHQSAIERRDRAIVAFLILTAVRIEALISLKLKHLYVENGFVHQRSNEVKTKRRKTIITHFFPVGDEIVAIVEEWVSFLKEEKLFGMDDPLFPRTLQGHDENMNFTPIGLEPEHWKTGQPVRKILDWAFTRAGLDYFNPHSFRRTIGSLGQRMCENPEEMKAWSQSMGHESVLTTFLSYGHVDPDRQGELMERLRAKSKKN
jgi:integrase